MSRPQSSTHTVSRIWTKSEKREHASRQIMEARKRTHQINRQFAQQQRMN